MPLSSSGAAIERDDAAMNGSSPQTVNVLRCDLADLAAMIARVEALVAADAAPEPAGSDPIERIADIAFILHERDVEASLCDALDAAVREISASAALKQERVQRARQAAQMLRALSQRINEVMARPGAEQHGEAARVVGRIRDELAPAVTRLSGPLPSPVAGGGTASDLPRRAGVIAALPAGPVQQTEQTTGQGAAKLASGAAKPHLSTAAAAMLSGKPEADPFLDEDLLVSTPTEAAAARNAAVNEGPSDEAPGDVPPSRESAIGSASPIESRDASASEKSSPLLDPDDDPDDLFEPATNMPSSGSSEPVSESAAPPSAPANGSPPVAQHAGAAGAAGIRQSSERAQAAATAAGAKNSGIGSRVSGSDALAPRFADTAIVPSAPRPAPSDPLAPVRALSEEELIALFS